MKRSLLFPLVFLLGANLTACSGGGSGSEADLVRQQYQSFSVDIPSDWNKILQQDFANTIPPETVAIFLKRIQGDDFIQNVNVIKESLNTDATSLEYAKANILLGSKALVDYRAISSEEVNVNGVRTVLHLFHARNTTTDPLRNYSQTYFAKDKIGYTLTCVAKEEDQVQQLTCQNIVRSFLLQ
ncbi:MAG: hypothetical protein Q8O95_00290 [bacterium]|nr:hypothetical protein [bacterium]